MRASQPAQKVGDIAQRDRAGVRGAGGLEAPDRTLERAPRLGEAVEVEQRFRPVAQHGAHRHAVVRESRFGQVEPRQRFFREAAHAKDDRQVHARAGRIERRRVGGVEFKGALGGVLGLVQPPKPCQGLHRGGAGARQCGRGTRELEDGDRVPQVGERALEPPGIALGVPEGRQGVGLGRRAGAGRADEPLGQVDGARQVMERQVLDARRQSPRDATIRQSPGRGGAVDLLRERIGASDGLDHGGAQ